MRARSQDRVVARAAQQPLGIGKLRDAEIGLVTGCGKGERQRGVANKSEHGKMGVKKRQATAPWFWENSRHGVVKHGPIMGSLATGSRENSLNSGTAVRCPQG